MRLLCWIRGHDQVIARPGRGGHMPPRSSMARATRASGERNPKAMRVRSRSFVFTLSTRAFDSPWLSAALMPARCSRMERASFTNAGSRQRQAHFSQASSSAMPCGALELKHLPKLLLEQVRPIERRVGLGDPGEGAGLAVG